jgi:multiple sugar transport system substrate-binding protein
MNKELTRRSFLKMAAVSAAGMALVACQPAPAATPTTESGEGPAEPPMEKTKITFSMYGHPGLVEQMVPIFNDTHSDVEVAFERSEGQGYWEKVTAAVAAGTAWDCFRGDATRALVWGPSGAVLDVKPFIDIDTTYPKEDYLDGILDVYDIEGKIYGVPTWALTMWMFYNKKMFDEAGLAYPTAETTWTEYVDMAKKLTKTDADGKITQFGANAWASWDFPVMQSVWSNGGHMYYNDDFTKVAMDDPKTVEALQALADLALVHKASPDPTVQLSSPTGILNDNVATEGNGDYLPADNNDVFMEKYEYLDAALCPMWGGNRTNIYWPDSFVLNAKTKYPEACYKWMSWFSRDPDATAIQCKVVFPVYKKAYEDNSIASRWLVAPRPKGMIAAAKDHVKNARLLKITTQFGDIEGVYYNEIGKLWSGEAKADEVAKTISDKGTEILMGGG